MLRPATPLTILFFIAFVLLVLATISTPIVKGIHLASFNGVNFGVFGYCTSSKCSSIEIGYSVDSKTLYGTAEDNSDFSLPSTTRSSLSSILIVHPVAALLTLICFVLSAAAHLHAPSHSPRYLLGVLILSIPTLLITLLAFLVDILLFVPHLAWGGWVVLVSTILILASGIVTCAMRRTLVSRKARKKRIAENSEMNGEAFYARQMVEPTGPRAETPPPLTNPGMGEKLPQFATYESNRSGEDDRVPLNQRTPSNKTLPSAPSSRAPAYSENGYDYPDGPGRGGRGGMRGGPRGGGSRGYGGTPRDEYGNPMPPSNAFGAVPPAGIRRDRSEPPRLRPQYSDEDTRSGGARGRGRGGYSQRGYGRGGPYGPNGGGQGRGGGLMGPGGQGMAAGNMRRGPAPPPDYGNGYPPPGRAGQYEGAGGPAGYARSPSAPTYGARRPSPQGPPPMASGYGRGPSPPINPGGYQRGPSPAMAPGPGGYQRGPSPAVAPAPRGYNDRPSPPPVSPQRAYTYDDAQGQYPQSHREERRPPPVQTGFPQGTNAIGQAVEMDAVNGLPSPVPSPIHMQIRDGDTDVQGFVGLQQQQRHRDSPMSLTSVYSSQEAYVPPRANWTGNARGVTPPPPSNLNHSMTADAQDADPVELPVQGTLRKGRSGSNPAASSHTRKASDNYYEDVDPRFAPDDGRRPTPQAQHQPHQGDATVPPALMPGLSSINTSRPQVVHNNPGEREVSDSYDDLPDGARSPASDMTSISQRGVNPNWAPGGTDERGRLEPPHHHHPQYSQRRPVPVPEQRGVIEGGGPGPQYEVPVRGAAGNRVPNGGKVEMGQAF